MNWSSAKPVPDSKSDRTSERPRDNAGPFSISLVSVNPSHHLAAARCYTAQVTPDQAKPSRAAKREARSKLPHYKWIVLGTVIFSLLVILLDVTVVNVSVPHILRDLKTDIAHIQWVFNAYTLAFAALLITFGRLGDMFGHKRMFMLGLATFGVGSALSGAAPSAGWLIAFRALQGIGGAMMMPATLSLTLQAFPARERGMALGFWGATAGIALAIGPTLGGFITDHYTWRWIFYINIPVCLLALTLAATYIHEPRSELHRHRLDIPGFATVTGGLLALTFALVEGQKYGWGSSLIIGLFVAAAVLLTGFALIERRAAEPMIDLRLFRDRNFTIGNIVALLVTFAMLGTFFLIPIFLQQVLGFTAFKTGLTLTPLAGAMLVAAPIVGKLSDRYPSKYFLILGLVLVSGALWLLSHFSEQTTATSLIGPFALFGAGLACVMPVMVNAALGSVPPEQYGAGSGILNTFRQTGGVFGVAIIGTFFSLQLATLVPKAVDANAKIPDAAKTYVDRQFNGGEIHLVSQSSPDETRLREAAAALPPGRRERAEEQLNNTQAAVKSSVGPAVTDAVNHSFQFAIPFVLLGALAAAFMRRRTAGGH